MSSTRQLAAIMFTDIAGYTALIGNDEQKAFELLKKNRALQKPIIEQFNGRWIKELGDGVMASFNTVSDAVNAAIKIQESCNAAKDFQLSIGIHQGEIIFENNDIYGDAVNIASRIQSLGVPGSVLFSKKITDEIRNKAEFKITSLGNYEFKNVEEPIEVFALSNPGFVVPKPEDMRGKLKTIPKQKSKKGILITVVIAVLVLSSLIIFKNSFLPGKAVVVAIKSLAILPFENLQKDSTLSFLSDGIPENLINRFSNLIGIKVFARSATFGLKDSARSIINLRKLLNADVVLTGRLMKTGNDYSLSCELIDASNQNLIWGNKYELTSDDISRVEDSIITSLMNPLQIAFMNNPDAVQKNKVVNPEAYAEYLKGRYLSYGSTPEESEKALSHFREAIRIDPKYAVAYAAIANEKIVQGLFSTAPKIEIVNEARTAIEAAKALDPGLADIYTSEGAIKFYYDWDWKGAINSFKKALELDPGNATIYIRYSTILADLGRYKEALPLADKAVELDPVSISSLHNLGWVNFLAGNYKKSSEAFGKALELHPTWVWGYLKKAYGHIFMKEYDKALSLAESGEKLFKDGWGSELLQTQLGFIYKNCNQKEKADIVINRFLKYAAENTLKDPFTLSFIYYLKGDNKKANEWEEKTMEGKFPSAYLMSIDKIYDKEYFQSEAHQNILKKMGFVK
jgi:class 3 adenylate cyclase/TolB-like protein